jgi:ankyrin repeat protein
MFSKIPKDVRASILYPYIMHSNTLEECIQDYPVIEIIEHHPKFNRNKALGYASQFGHFNIVKYLISKGADVYAGNDEAVRWASEGGQLQVVKYLVSLGADIHAKND